MGTDIQSGIDRLCYSVFVCICYFMLVGDKFHSFTIRYYVSFKSPFLT